MHLRNFMFFLTSLTFVPSLGCQPSIGDATDTNDEESDSDSNPTSNQPTGGDDFGLCNADNPCPSGQFCFNGLCSLGCNSNGDCADDQYCDTEFKQCHNKEVQTCPDTPCPSGQECVQGLCSAGSTNKACEQMPNGQDGCASNELCFDDEEAGKAECYPFPACGEDGSCPTGTEGAVCNNDFIPSKDRICLIGLCETTDNCPAGQNCIKFQGFPVGECSNGSFGESCTMDSHCLSNNCEVFDGDGVCL